MVTEANVFGCMVTHDLIQPDYCVVGDKVGGNLNMIGDGHIRGQCPVGSVPQKKVSKKEKHFTVLPLTLLSGEPLMCIIIISGVRYNVLLGMGLDGSADMVNNVSDSDFIQNNSGAGKLFPDGPSCIFNVKTIPCFIRRSKTGSITSEILCKALAELDHRNVFSRINGLNPFLLVYDHGS